MVWLKTEKIHGERIIAESDALYWLNHFFYVITPYACIIFNTAITPITSKATLYVDYPWGPWVW